MRDGAARYAPARGDDDGPSAAAFVPAVGPEAVFLPVGPDLHAVDRETARARWVERIGRVGPVDGTTGRVYPPTLHGGTLSVTVGRYMSQGAGYLAAVDASSGAREWEFAAGLDFENYRGPPGQASTRRTTASERPAGLRAASRRPASTPQSAGRA